MLFNVCCSFLKNLNIVLSISYLGDSFLIFNQEAMRRKKCALPRDRGLKSHTFHHGRVLEQRVETLGLFFFSRKQCYLCWHRLFGFIPKKLSTEHHVG